MSEPQPLITYDPLNPNEPTRLNKSKPSQFNSNIQLNNPTALARRRPKPRIATPAEMEQRLDPSRVYPSLSNRKPPVNSSDPSNVGGRRRTRRKHKKSRKTHRRRN
jgi:hypothetical protein